MSQKPLSNLLGNVNRSERPTFAKLGSDSGLIPFTQQVSFLLDVGDAHVLFIIGPKHLNLRRKWRRGDC